MVGITGATTQTGIAAGLNMFTWVTQIAGVFWGKYAGRRTIMLVLWPAVLFGLVGMCVSTVFAEKQEGTKSAAIACVAMVWFYLGTFNAANPVLWSYPSEVQTFSMRSKGLLVWNTVSQLFGGYTSWVDPVALSKIGWRYYIVYMPLIVIQWILMYFCELTLSCDDNKLIPVMVETYGYTLEEIAIAFDGSTANLLEPSYVDTNQTLAALEADQGSASEDLKAREAHEGDVKATSGLP